MELKIDFVGEFATYSTWVNKASTRIDRDAICVDSEGYICRTGKHFMAARDAGRFPVRYGWPIEPPSYKGSGDASA